MEVDWMDFAQVGRKYANPGWNLLRVDVRCSFADTRLKVPYTWGSERMLAALMMTFQFMSDLLRNFA